MNRLSVTKIAADVASGAVTAAAVAQDALERRAAYDAVQPQAWITQIAAGDVLDQAAQVDARIKAGEKLALAGVPFAVKDNIDVAGLPTTAACPAFAYEPEQTAESVRRLLEAGAVLLGKTNLDQFATGLNGARSPYGAPTCVFNHDYISGGSSSGSAVVTAAGVVAFALGTDTAGSGRVPAAINHLIGFKPTKGRWSTRGLVPACRSLDCISVFTDKVADAALLDAVVAGFDPGDIYSRSASAKPVIAAPRLGFAAPSKLDFDGDDQSRTLYGAAAAHLATLGAPVEVDIAPLLACAKLLYDGPWVAERTAALRPLLQSNPSAIHPVVRAIVARGLEIGAADAFDGQYQLQIFMREAERMWGDIDVLVLPTVPTVYTLSELRADPIGKNSKLGLYTNFVNLLDMSAIAIPAGFRGNGTGFGVTLIAPAWAEATLLSLAQRYEESFAMPDTPPLDRTAPVRGVRVAVVGAHLQGMPLHHQLADRGARFLGAAKSAPSYKLYAMQTTPPKPALIFDTGGAAIALELYELSHEAFGAFTEEIPAPLAMGNVTLEDGSTVKGFVAEPRAMTGARDITAFGGWRAYIASLKA
ncbi:MAG: allophanate hydrolase [Hyphomonadaceae bacterium]|nr:allophanate hydrolase [Hyphomonadaceae bacterium]